MKVKDLIVDLSTMDPEADVHISVLEGCGGIGDSYNVSYTDSWDASEKYNTPATASIYVDKGCMCCSGTKIQKFSKGPQDLNQRTLGIQEAIDVISEDLKHYSDRLAMLGNGKDYKEHMEVERYGQAKRALEHILKMLGKKIS